MANGNGFFERVMDGRVIKQGVALLCGRRPRSGDIFSQSSLRATLLGESDVSEPQNSSSVAANSNADEVMNDDEANAASVSTPGPLYSLIPASVARDQENLTKPPLTARYPELFCFKGKHGEIESALSLTKVMVWQWNTIIRCKKQIAAREKELDALEKEQLEVEDIIAEIGESLQRKSEDPSFDPSKDLQDLENAREIALELQLEREQITGKRRQARDEMELPKFQLFRDLEEVMEENNLLEIVPEEDDRSPANPNFAQEALHEISKPKTPTASEAAQHAMLDAQDDAVEHMHQAETRLQRADQIVHDWNDYYNSERHEFEARVREGTVKTTRSMFDGIMLQEQREATQALIKAEAGLEEARNEVRRLGVAWVGSDQESGFPDYDDDGYRESQEAAWATHVDRDRIHRWMDNEEDKSAQTPECDEWDAKTVDLCDSGSVVAQGKERTRILRWRQQESLLRQNLGRDNLGEVS
jgi:hypothetical protein